MASNQVDNPENHNFLNVSGPNPGDTRQNELLGSTPREVMFNKKKLMLVYHKNPHCSIYLTYTY